MIPETVIRGLLTAAAGVTALVGSRIYPPGSIESPTFPALIVDLLKDEPDPPIFAAAGPNIATAVVRVVCYSRTYAELQTLSSAVRSACHLKYGVLSGYQVISIKLAWRGPEGGGYAFDQRAHIHALDFQIVFQE